MSIVVEIIFHKLNNTNVIASKVSIYGHHTTQSAIRQVSAKILLCYYEMGFDEICLWRIMVQTPALTMHKHIIQAIQSKFLKM